MADSNRAIDFVDYLKRHPAVREVLKDGLVEDIVAEGAARGYLFDAGQLHAALVSRANLGDEWKQTALAPARRPRRG